MMRLSTRTITLLIASFLLASKGQATVTGRVLNLITHEPIPNAEVTLSCIESEYRNSACGKNSTTTSQEGAFSFNAFNAAKYSLSANAAGMAQTKDSSIDFVISYRRHVNNFSADLQLAPESTISGQVVDPDRRPRPGIEVIAWRQYTTGPFTRLRAVSKTVSDKAGGYVFRKLPPGNYYVATLLPKPGAPPPRPNEVIETFPIYAPSAFTLSDANVIHLGIGESTEHIELRLRPFLIYHLEGRAQMEPMGQAVSGDLSLYLDPRNESGLAAPGRELDLHPDGTFEANVLPGLYTLRLVGVTVPNVTSPNTTSKSKDAPPMRLHLLAKQDIEISGKDIYDIALLISPPFTIDGHVSVESQPNQPVGSGEITLQAVDPIAPAGSAKAKIESDGSFSVSNTDAVTYAVRCSPPSGMYVKSMDLNGQDALAHYLDLSKSSGGQMKVVLQPGAASVTISQRPDSSASEVILIPDIWTDSSLTPILHLASHGNVFSAIGLTPGGYTAVATTQLDQQTWANDAFVKEIKSRGTPFLLRENEQKTITAAEISRDDIDQIELRLGIY